MGNSCSYSLKVVFFWVSNLLLNILEYYLIGLNFDYPIRQSSFWILLQTSLSLLAGAVLNQGIQLILPLGELSKNLEAISLYLGISFFLSTGITLILRKLLLSHQRLRIATSKGNWLYQFIVPLLSIFFAFTISAIQGGVFGADYLSIISLSSLYFNLYLARQQQQYYQKSIGKMNSYSFKFEKYNNLKKSINVLTKAFGNDLKNKHLTSFIALEKNPEEAKDYLYSLTDSIVGEQTFYFLKIKLLIF